MKTSDMCIAGLVLLLVILLIGRIFFRERYSSDATDLINVNNKSFKAGDTFQENFVEMVPYNIEYKFSVTSSPDFTGTFSLIFSDKESNTNIVFNDAKSVAKDGVGVGIIEGSKTSPTTVALGVTVKTGSLEIKNVRVVANGPVKGAPRVANASQVSSGGGSLGELSTAATAQVSRTEALFNLKKELDDSGLSLDDKNTLVREVVMVADSDKSKDKIVNMRMLLLPILAKVPSEKQNMIGRAIDKVIDSSATTTSPGMRSRAVPTMKPKSMQELIADKMKSQKTIMTKGPTMSVISSPGMYRCESDSEGFRCTRAS